jgi:hypothetical protein
MGKKRLDQCKTGPDFVGYARRTTRKRGGSVKEIKAGVLVKGPPDGPAPDDCAVIHSNHPRELATGTRAALIKKLIALGLGLMVLAAIIPALM